MENQPASTRRRKRPSALRIAIPVVVLLVGGYFVLRWINYNRHFESTDNAQVETHTSPVLARVAGYLQQVNIQDYSEVKKGDTLAVIDNAEYQIAVQQAEADYKQAQADYQQTQASIGTAQADLLVAQSNLSNANLNAGASSTSAEAVLVRRNKAFQDYQRNQALYAEKAITQKQLEDSKAAYEEAVKQYEAAVNQSAAVKGGTSTAQAQIRRAQAQLQSINAQLKRAESSIDVRKAALDQARLRLSYTIITAPIDGKIGRKNMEPGQYVQPGQNLCTIVNDDTYWVVANFKETQIEQMQEGQPAHISLDAYPDLDLNGKVGSLSEATGAKFALLPPDNASGNFVKVTQRVPVRISIDHPEQYKGKLRAGLSAEVEIRVKE